MAFKALLSSALFAAACAAPAGPPAYGAPAPYPAEPAYPDLPPVYKYTYAVKDDYSFSNFNAHEERDGYNAAGGYQVALPDGRTQIVTYVSGPVSIFHDFLNARLASICSFCNHMDPIPPAVPFILKYLALRHASSHAQDHAIHHQTEALSMLN